VFSVILGECSRFISGFPHFDGKFVFYSCNCVISRLYIYIGGHVTILMR